MKVRSLLAFPALNVQFSLSVVNSVSDMSCAKFLSSLWKSDIYQTESIDQPITTVQDIPGEILLHIFQYCVGQHSFLRLRLVCKEWSAKMSSVINLRLIVKFSGHLSLKFGCSLSHQPISKSQYINPISINNNRLKSMVKEFVIDVPSYRLVETITSFKKPLIINTLIIKTSSIRELESTIHRSELENYINHKNLHIESEGLSLGDIEGLDLLALQSSTPMQISVGF